MPVYNEEGAVAGVLEAWTAELDRLGLDYRIRAYDDGSRDSTPRILQGLAIRHPRLLVSGHENRGHGPTVLRGYREAEGEWVFQVDSDGEMPAAEFASLWRLREGYDLLVGSRSQRKAPLLRRLVTGVSRLTVYALLGAGVHDVNSPYRLMRRSRLQALLPELPEAAFAPNVILSGLFSRAGWRIFERPVPCRGRQTGVGSLNRTRVVKGALRSFAETFEVAWRVRTRGFNQGSGEPPSSR